jgi:flavin reductase (DIM6/NTAB) family NADH-FMN oxidoreductase RutF
MDQTLNDQPPDDGGPRARTPEQQGGAQDGRAEDGGSHVAGRLASASNHAMVIVTAGSDGGPDGGCLVGFHTQASIDPWRHCVFLSVANHTHKVASTSTHLAVHMIGIHGGKALAALFGSVTEDSGVDKFAHCRWHRSPLGPPLLDDAAAWFVGAIVGRMPAGDHEAFLLEAVETQAPAHLPPPLRFGDVSDLEPGHAADD